MSDPISLTRIQQASEEAEKIRYAIGQLTKTHHAQNHYNHCDDAYALEGRINTLQLYLNDATEHLVDHFVLSKILKLILIGSCIGFSVGFWFFSR